MLTPDWLILCALTMTLDSQQFNNAEIKLTRSNSETKLITFLQVFEQNLPFFQTSIETYLLSHALNLYSS